MTPKAIIIDPHELVPGLVLNNNFIVRKVHVSPTGVKVTALDARSRHYNLGTNAIIPLALNKHLVFKLDIDFEAISNQLKTKLDYIDNCHE